MNFTKYFEYAKNLGFTDIEFKVKSEKKFTIGVFHQKVEEYTVSETETILARGIIEGNMVAGSTENKKDLYKILDQMKENGSFIDDKKEQEIFGGSPKYKNRKLYNPEIVNIPAEDKIRFLLDMEKHCYEYDSRIADVETVNYRELEESLSIVNSKGLKLSYRTNYGVVILGVVARDDGDTRTGYAIKVGQKESELDSDAMVKEACDYALKALHGTQCKSKKYKTILNNETFASLLDVFLKAFSGDDVNKGRSMLKDKLNTQVASNKLTLIEDPQNIKYPYAYRAFDDEGVATYKKVLVEKGVLKTYLYNLESSKVAGTSSTGNGYGSSVIGVSNGYTYVKPGKKSLEELASKVGSGVLITDLQGLHSGMNPLSGNFSLQACGFMIEDGKITYPLNLITVAGNLFDMLKDIKEVGGDMKVSLSGIECPSVIIGKLAVSGK